MMTEFLSNDLWQALIPALLHTLWIGLLAAAVLAVTLRRLAPVRANLRYGLSIAALLGIVAGGVLAWAAQERWNAVSAAESTESEILTAAGSFPTHDGSRAATQGERGSSRRSASTPAGRAGDPEASPSAGTSLPPDSAVRRWKDAALSWLPIVWLAGLGIMLARLLLSVTGAHSLRRDSGPPDNSRLEVIAAELATTLKLDARALVRIGRGIASPAVIGILRPVILWPASWATGLSECQMRAVLAHELAHIQRHDYLANLCQMLIEAVLFFNPAVWWISRQIRIEREACCDAVAACAIGSPQTLASTLADAADAIPGAAYPLASALAFADNVNGSLLDRIRRLLEPAYRPMIRTPWPSLLALIFVACGCLVVLKETGDVVAQAIIPHNERIARMQRIEEEFGKKEIPEREYGEADKITIRARIESSDGRPLSRNLHVDFYVNRPRHSSHIAVSAGGFRNARFLNQDTVCEFEHRIEYGKVWFAVMADGFAPTFSGPFLTEPGGKIDAGKVSLEKGFPITIQCLDPDGNPVPEVQVSGSFAGPMRGGYRKLTANAEGEISVHNCATMPLELTATAPGFETTKKTFDLQPKKTFKWVLSAAEPTTGMVLDARTKKPIGNASIHLLSERAASTMSYSPKHGPLLTTTDARGSFTLSTFNRQGTYYIYVTAPNYCPQIVPDVTAGLHDLRIEMKPPITLRGKFVNVREEDLNDEGQLKVTLHHRGRTASDHTDMWSLGTLELPVSNHEAPFTLSNVWESDLTIAAAGIVDQWSPGKATENIRINLQELRTVNEQKRADFENRLKKPITIHLIPPDGAPAVRGKLSVEYTKTEWRPYARGREINVLQREKYPVESDGTVRFSIPFPTRLELKPDGLLGYTFDPLWHSDGTHRRGSVELEADASNFEATLKLIPAGAIFGRVLERDGAPAHSVLIGLSPDKGVTLKDSAGGEADTDSEFHASPLPFDQAYYVVAHRTDSYVCSEPIQLTAQNPFRELTLRFPECITLAVQAIDSNGNSLAGIPLGLNFSTPAGGYGRSPNPLTDRDGWVQFKDVVTNQPAGCAYTIEAKPERDFQMARISWNGKTNPVRIQIARGATLEGRLVDATTGKPMPNAEVYASPNWDKYWEEGHSYVDADNVTDAEGRFRFTRLAPRPYNLHSRSGSDIREYTVTGGQEGPVELRVRASDWYRDREWKQAALNTTR